MANTNHHRAKAICWTKPRPKRSSVPSARSGWILNTPTYSFWSSICVLMERCCPNASPACAMFSKRISATWCWWPDEQVLSLCHCCAYLPIASLVCLERIGILVPWQWIRVSLECILVPRQRIRVALEWIFMALERISIISLPHVRFSI